MNPFSTTTVPPHGGRTDDATYAVWVSPEQNVYQPGVK
jgi:hypothetical protein